MEKYDTSGIQRLAGKVRDAYNKALAEVAQAAIAEPWVAQKFRFIVKVGDNDHDQSCMFDDLGDTYTCVVSDGTHVVSRYCLFSHHDPFTSDVVLDMARELRELANGEKTAN